MARQASPELMRHMAEWAMTDSDVDRYLSPRAMRAFLEFRLYTIDAQIDALFRRSIDAFGPHPTWVWNQHSDTEEKLSSWTSINYLLTARDKLRDMLRSIAD